MAESDTQELADLVRLSLEKERLDLERAKFESEKADHTKRMSVFLPIIVSIAAVVVSAAQVGITLITRDKELELQRFEAVEVREQQRQMHEMQVYQTQVEAQREWSLKFASFVAEHSADVFSHDSTRRKQMRAVIQLTYPLQSWDSIFDKFADAAPTVAIRDDWRSAEREAREKWLPPPVVQINPNVPPAQSRPNLIPRPSREKLDTGLIPPALQSPTGRLPTLLQEMITEVNQYRVSVGCNPLIWSQQIANAAQAQSDDMARRDYFNHESPEGLGPADRLRAHGVTFRAMGENIALHPGAPREVLAQWVASPGHRRNLEQCTYTHHGIGLRNGLWTHLFITPLPPARPAGP